MGVHCSNLQHGRDLSYCGSTGLVDGSRFIPIVNLAWLNIPIDLAKSFGKGAGFGVGLLLLGFIFTPILALGDASYEGPSAAGGSATKEAAAPT